MRQVKPVVAVRPTLRRSTRLVAVVALAAIAMATAASARTQGAVVPRDPGCQDRAQPIAVTRLGEGEPSVKVPQRDPDRLVATWTLGSRPEAGSPVLGAVVLGQRDQSGRWSKELLGPPALRGDSSIDTAPNGSVSLSGSLTRVRTATTRSS